jgi:hypothetical protein
MEGVLKGSLVDPINGGSATMHIAGLAGESGSTYNAAWPSTAGAMWRGGNGCEFGAGGSRLICDFIDSSFTNIFFSLLMQVEEVIMVEVRFACLLLL